MSRITSGTFVASGEKSRIEDQYTEPRAAHMILDHTWIGTTEFKEIGKPIDIEANHEHSNSTPSKWADLAFEEEFQEVV